LKYFCTERKLYPKICYSVLSRSFSGSNRVVWFSNSDTLPLG